ncbi:uncharacterized protein CDAR_437631 [Caerostris darwini]|uniref:Uncharacterized protein n=1 Tax=Caerostris darwini TaxID=1538125 RepID=A0AAV4NWC6_9ARAC|nr:uncharacterized protein CDAR_437631 [Caerostris darwini]
MPWNNNCADSVNQKPHCQQENFPGKYEHNKEIPPFRALATPAPPVGTNRHQSKSFLFAGPPAITHISSSELFLWAPFEKSSGPGLPENCARVFPSQKKVLFLKARGGQARQHGRRLRQKEAAPLKRLGLSKKLTETRKCLFLHFPVLCHCPQTGDTPTSHTNK